MVSSWGKRLGFGSSQRRQDILTAYLCLLPWLLGFLAFVVGPMLFSLGLSFYESDLLTQTYLSVEKITLRFFETRCSGRASRSPSSMPSRRCRWAPSSPC